MKICAVICEYNPFHSGHELHLKEARKQTGCDAVICIMSGNFVQRASFSAIDYYFRAKTAILSSADAVLIMPSAVSVSCAEKFAEGAVNILSQIENVTHLCFGSENPSLSLLTRIAEIQCYESEAFSLKLKEQLSLGKSYASALTLATAECASSANEKDEIIHALSLPNNVLGIEYIKALKKANSKIEPFCVLRKDAGYLNLTLENEFASASAIREAISRNDMKSAERFLPKATKDEIMDELKSNPINEEIFSALTVFALRNTAPENFADCPNELKNLFNKAANGTGTIDGVIATLKSKRYPLSRLKRIMLYALLGITDKHLSFSFPLYCRLSAVKSDFKKHIGIFPETVIKQNAEFKILSQKNSELVEIDTRAESVYSLITGGTQNPFFKRKLECY